MIKRRPPPSKDPTHFTQGVRDPPVRPPYRLDSQMMQEILVHHAVEGVVTKRNRKCISHRKADLSRSRPVHVGRAGQVHRYDTVQRLKVIVEYTTIPYVEDDS